MATQLFINRTDLVRNSIMDGNISTDKFIQFVKIAQEIDVQQIMGTDLYNGLSAAIPNIDDPANARWKTILDDYIVPMLIWYAHRLITIHLLHIRLNRVEYLNIRQKILFQ